MESRSICIYKYRTDVTAWEAHIYLPVSNSMISAVIV